MSQTIYRKLKDLKKLANNPRTIYDDDFKRLCDSVQNNADYFKARPLILSNRTGELVILAGNQRYEAAKRLKFKEVPTHLLENLTEEREKEIIIRDNVANGQWDFELLDSGDWDLQDLTDWGVVMPDFEAIEDDGEPQDAEAQIDKAELLNEKWQVKKGDLFSIGSHRLLCGDSTKREDISTLLNGEKADACITDPPYGVLKNEWDRPLTQTDVDCALENTIGAVMMFNATKTEIMRNILQFDPMPERMCVWRLTSSISPTGSGMFWTWQPIFMWRTLGILGWDSIDFVNEMPTKTGDHPTQKPVNLIQKLISAITDCKTVYEPFAGSGTTLVACQNLNRKCYAIEISENYCAVILQRMTDAFPDLEIKRISQSEAANG